MASLLDWLRPKLTTQEQIEKYQQEQIEKYGYRIITPARRKGLTDIIKSVFVAVFADQEHFPSEITQHIFSWLSIIDLMKIERVSKSFQANVGEVIRMRAKFYGFESLLSPKNSLKSLMLCANSIREQGLIKSPDEDENVLISLKHKEIAEIFDNAQETTPHLEYLAKFCFKVHPIPDDLKKLDRIVLKNQMGLPMMGKKLTTKTKLWKNLSAWNGPHTDYVFRILLLMGANPNKTMELYIDKYNKKCNLPLLYVAAKSNRTSIVKLLLEHGARVDESGPLPCGKTALQISAKKGNTEIMTALLDLGANVNFNGKRLSPALAFTSIRRRERVESARLLIERKANVNQRCKDQRTPIFFAACNGHLKIMDLLIQNHANCTLLDIEGKSVLHWAVIYKNYEAIRKLLNTTTLNLNIQDRGGNTPIMHAVKNRDLKAIHILHEYKANLDKVLHLAYDIKWIDGLKECVKLKANLNTVDGKGTTVLIKAIKENQSSLVAFLIDQGAYLRGAAHAAYDYNKIALFKSMINSGADVNELVGNKTLLVKAVEKNDKNTVQVLLSQNADCTIPGPDQRTPLQIALRSKYFDIASMLLEDPTSVMTHKTLSPVYIAVEENASISLIKKIYEHSSKLNLNFLSEESILDNSTPLHLAVIKGNFEAMLYLLKMGASEGADINAVTSTGATALHLAIEGRDQRQTSLILSTLLSFGADRTIRNKEGKTPKDLARKLGKKDWILLLKKLPIAQNIM